MVILKMTVQGGGGVGVCMIGPLLRFDSSCELVHFVIRCLQLRPHLHQICFGTFVASPDFSFERSEMIVACRDSETIGGW